MRNASLLLAAMLAALTLGAGKALAAEEPKEAETCGACHEQETKEWTESPHATAINDRYLAEWKREGEKWECLVCHTSRYDRKSGWFSHAGVSCESCHGPASKDHPDTAKKLLPVSSETCQGCHSVTYGEWRISSHGQKNIRCFDCHKMHLMRLRKDDPDQMCGTCHTERLKDFSHATHHLKGVKCINCHMPEVMGAGLKIKGTGTRGHSFGVGAETCANCHREMVHARRDHLDMEAEIERLKGLTSPALQQQVKDLRQEMDQLRVTLQSNRRAARVFPVLAFGLGAAVGYGVMRKRYGKIRQEGPPK